MSIYQKVMIKHSRMKGEKNAWHTAIAEIPFRTGSWLIIRRTYALVWWEVRESKSCSLAYLSFFLFCLISLIWNSELVDSLSLFGGLFSFRSRVLSRHFCSQKYWNLPLFFLPLRRETFFLDWKWGGDGVGMRNIRKEKSKRKTRERERIEHEYMLHCIRTTATEIVVSCHHKHRHFLDDRSSLPTAPRWSKFARFEIVHQIRISPFEQRSESSEVRVENRFVLFFPSPSSLPLTFNCIY